ncbi:MAG TPA: AmmeMemoRadiSam system protein B [Geothrix sp.]|nr:AmmeMemoRadiSam system protein B [Geothrix sp.]
MGQVAEVRPPAVAGSFYPGDARALRRDLRGLLAGAVLESETWGEAPPKALIVPHAGYIYSGPVAASAYATLGTQRDRIKRVVLLGPTHRVAIAGLALPGVSAFETPLGLVPLDLAAMEQVQSFPQVLISPAAHALEHSLEVQLPFLQTVLDAFHLVPLAVGEASPESVAEVIEALWGGPETLVIVSSDLCHYRPYHEARELDARTWDSIQDLQMLRSHEQACGATPLNGLLLAARRRGLKPRLLDLRNSGDTAGDHRSVVGYGAFAFANADDGT